MTGDIQPNGDLAFPRAPDGRCRRADRRYPDRVGPGDCAGNGTAAHDTRSAAPGLASTGSLRRPWGAAARVLGVPVALEPMAIVR